MVRCRYYSPDYKLTVPSKQDMNNHNSDAYLDELRTKILEHLSHVAPAPSVAFHDRPPDAVPVDDIPRADTDDEQHRGVHTTGDEDDDTYRDHGAYASGRNDDSGEGRVHARLWSGEVVNEEDERKYDAMMTAMGSGGNGRVKSLRADISYRDHVHNEEDDT